MDARKIGAIAAAILFVACMSAFAAPIFRYEGVIDEGGGVYRHDYVLDNFDPAAPSNNVEDMHYNGNPVKISAFWIEVGTPNGWSNEIVTDISHWRVDQSGGGVQVGAELAGFYIRASVPVVTASPFTFTYDRDDDLSIIYEGEALLPGHIIPAKRARTKTK